MAENEQSPAPPPPVEPAVPDEPPPPAAGPLGYDGGRKELMGLGIKVSLLTLITLGFYRFWGKTRIRQYLWSRVSLYGNRLEYTGTGKELFLGFLIVLAVLLPLGLVNGILQVAVGVDSLTYSLFEVAQGLLLAFLIGFATYRARRYRLSRTLLRGIRFAQGGSAGKYAVKWFLYLLLTIVTLGIARPWGDVAVHRYIMENTWFGGQKFAFEGHARDMIKPWIICLLLALLTLGLSLVWYAAFKTRYLVGGTRFQDLRLSLPLAFKDLVKIYAIAIAAFLLFVIVTALVVTPAAFVLSFGTMTGEALTPLIPVLTIVVFGSVVTLVFITHPMLALIAARFAVEGEVDFEKILQSAQESPKTGEGLADALDVGGGLEVGL